MSKKKIKLCFIISNLSQGGAERQFVHIINGINKNKFDVTLILYAVQKKIFFSEILNTPNVTVIRNTLKSKYYIFKIIEALFFLRKKLKRSNFDVLISFLFMNSFFVRLCANHRFNNRIITGVRSSFDNGYNFFYKLVEKYYISRNYLVFNSDDSRLQALKFIGKKHENKLIHINNGYNSLDCNQNSFFKKSISFGCLGRQNIVKNFIQPARIFNKKNFSEKNIICLKIKGSKGNQSNELVAIRNKNKNFLKLIKESPQIDRFFDSIQFLIIPSLFEGTANVMFESMIRGKLCIIAERANSDNVIRNNFNGLTYKNSDDELVKVVKKSLKISRNKYLIMSNNAKKDIVEKYSMKNVCIKYERLISEINEKN